MSFPSRFVHCLLVGEAHHTHENTRNPALHERLGRVAPDCRETGAWLKADGNHYAA
jgi:hypothetical protein